MIRMGGIDYKAIWFRVLTGFFIVALTVSTLSFNRVFASIAECSVSITPSSVLPGSQNAYILNVTNNDPQGDIRSILVLRPSANFEITGGSDDRWIVTPASDQISYSDGSIEPGGTQTLSFEAVAGQNQAGPANWSVFVSDQNDGSDAVGCQGTTSTSISNQAPFSISGTAASAVTSNSATISWLTNRPASSRVNFGKTASYGQSVTNGDGSLRTQHSINLTNLSPSTTYHYQTASTASGNESATSSDNTFTTPAASVVTTPPAATGGSTSNATASTISLASNPFIKAVPTETVPPVISTSTKLQKIYKDTPTIEGTAIDNSGIALIEYSIDNGLNWLLADKVVGLGSTRVSFSFTAKNLLDGNYDIVVRATDTSRNQTSSIVGLIVIDKLPPTTGGSVISIGSQFVQPDDDGTLTAIAGVDQKITLNAVGGATSVAVEAYEAKAVAPKHVFNLAKSTDSGLWTGAISFSEGGTYELRATSIDGADNRLNKVLGRVEVKNKGRVSVDKVTNLTNSDVHVYYKDPQTKNWVYWNAESYSQSNPAQTSDKNGYSFYLPAGTYYLKAQKTGYYTATTQSFTLSSPQAVSSDIILKKAVGVSIGSKRLQLPAFSTTRIQLGSGKGVKSTATQSVKAIPAFDLARTDGSRIRTVDLYGKPTIISLVSTWSPDSQDQLPKLAELAKEYPELNVLPVSSGESLSRLIAQNTIAGYEIPVAADVNNTLINSLNSSSLPTHFFIDRRGIVSKQVIGVLSKEELLKNVEN